MSRPALPSPTTVHALRLADLIYPEGHPRYGETGPVFAFLVDHPDGPVLVDTGIGPPHQLIDRLYKPARYPLEEALAGLGLAPKDVRLIVKTETASCCLAFVSCRRATRPAINLSLSIRTTAQSSSPVR